MPEPIKKIVVWFLVHWPLSVSILAGIAYLIAKGFPLVKAWFGLRKEKLEGDKTALEIKKLEKEERTVVLATDEEIKTFDPKTRKLLTKLRRTGGSGDEIFPYSFQGPNIFMFIFLLGICYAVIKWLLEHFQFPK